MKKIKEFIKQLWNLLRLPEMLILPGNLAFFLILALFPIITLIGIVASSLSLSTVSITNILGEILPSGIIDILVPFLSTSSITTGNILFIFVGLYLASNGPDSIITASNILYKNESKSYVFRRIKAIFMTFWMIVLFIVILIFMAFGSFILTKILNFGAVGEFIAQNYAIITIWKLVFAFIFIFIAIKIIYAMAPDQKIKSKFVNRGSLFSTVTIMIVTTIYSFYVTNFAHYDVLYGSVANIAVLMLLVYIISYVIVLGIAINNSYYNLDNFDTNMKSK